MYIMPQLKKNKTLKKRKYKYKMKSFRRLIYENVCGVKHLKEVKVQKHTASIAVVKVERRLK